jgi:hypothetical protein
MAQSMSSPGERETTRHTTSSRAEASSGSGRGKRSAAPDDEGTLRHAVDKAMTTARKVGKKVATKVVDTSEMIGLQRTDRALRGEIEDLEQRVGRRVYTLHRRAVMRGAESPFIQFKAIVSDLDDLRTLEHERQVNREQMATLREEKRGHHGRGRS